MRSVVPSAFLAFTEPLEGGVPCLYNDIYGGTTIAYGDLCNTPAAVVALPLMKPGGIPATAAEKVAAFYAVHDDPLAASKGWRYAATLTTLRLTREAMSELALAKLASNDAALRKMLPDWEDYPANVQLAMHSWAWAVGTASPYPRLFAALKARDFVRAAVEVHIDEDGPDHIRGTADDNRGLIARNRANKILLRNAARGQAFHLDPDELNWTVDLTAAEAATTPSLDNPPSDPRVEQPVLEDDGGASRREATSWAVDELAQHRDDDEGSGN